MLKRAILSSEMNLTDFTPSQRQALLDLLVLGMYADGHLAVAENEKLQQLLTTLGCETQFDRDQQLDAAVTRIRQHARSAEAVRAHVLQLAAGFATREERQQVCALLEGLMASDRQVTPSEGQFVSVVRGLLQA